MGLSQGRQPEQGKNPEQLPFLEGANSVLEIAIKEAREDKSNSIGYLRFVSAVIRDQNILSMFPEVDVEFLRTAHHMRLVARRDSGGESNGGPTLDAQAQNLIVSANDIAIQIGRTEITPLDLFSAYLKDQRRRTEEKSSMINTKISLGDKYIKNFPKNMKIYPILRQEITKKYSSST